MTPAGSTEIPPAEISTEPTVASNLSLAKRVRSGFSWNVASALITEAIRFLRSIILARLLVPEAFGLFAMALTILGAFNAVSTLGLSRTIVAHQFDSNDELRAHLDTVWTVELIRSFLVALLVFASAVPMSWFYGEDQLKIIIPLLGLTTLIEALRNVGLNILRKQISFARIFWFEVATNVTGVVLTVVLAIFFRNVWALVIGLLITSAIGTVLSYVFHSYRPRFALEKQALSRVLTIGKITLLIAITMYVMNMADNIMVGRLLGSNALGNYSLAFNISSAPISVLVFSLGTVLFPAYSEITAQRPETLGVTFTKTFSLAMLAIVTLGVSLSLVASDTVQVLFGDQWSAAGMALRILALAIPLRGLSSLISTFFWGLNRPRDVAFGTAVEAVIFLATLYPFIKMFGLRGAAWAAIVAYTFGCGIRLKVLGQIVPGISGKLFQISVAIVVAAAIGLVVGWLSLNFLASPLSRMMIAGILSVSIPPAILFLIKTDIRRSIVELFS